MLGRRVVIVVALAVVMNAFVGGRKVLQVGREGRDLLYRCSGVIYAFLFIV
jgi:hypothetical protein